MSAETTESSSVEARIFAAAKRALLEHGVQKTKIDQIAAEVGLQRPNLYRYFPSKNALVLEVLLHETREIQRERRRRVPIRGPVGPLLVRSLLLGFELSQSGGVLQKCLAEDSHRTTELLRQPEAVTAATEYWAPLLQHGRNRGEINTNLADEEIVRWFVGIQLLLHEHADLFHGPASIRDYVTKLAIPGVLTSRGLKSLTTG